MLSSTSKFKGRTHSNRAESNHSNRVKVKCRTNSTRAKVKCCTHTNRAIFKCCTNSNRARESSECPLLPLRIVLLPPINSCFLPWWRMAAFSLPAVSVGSGGSALQFSLDLKDVEISLPALSFTFWPHTYHIFGSSASPPDFVLDTT